MAAAHLNSALNTQENKQKNALIRELSNPSAVYNRNKQHDLLKYVKKKKKKMRRFHKFNS